VELSDVVVNTLGRTGKMLSGSKGQYRYDHPNHMVYFNANLVLSDGTKLWYGDLDITVQEIDIRALAAKLSKTIHILPEMAARFEFESNPDLRQCVYHTDGEDVWFNTEYYHRVDDRVVVKPILPLTEQELQVRVEETKAMYLEVDYSLIYGMKDMDEGDEYIRPPDFFAGVTEDKSPLHNFCTFIKGLGVEDKYCLDVYLSRESYEHLKHLYEMWFRAYNYYLGEYRIEKAVSWAMFDVGPACFMEDPEWVFCDNIYLKKKDK